MNALWLLRLLLRLCPPYLGLRTNAGDDLQALVMGGGLAAGADTNLFGFATSVTATSLTNTGAAWTAARYKGHIVFAGPNTSGTGSQVFGVILTNTATVLTVDRWYNATTLAAGTTPNGTASYVIAPGGAPAWWFAMTENADAPVDTDVQLTAELVVGSSAGLERAILSWAHTAGASSYTLSKTFTLTGATARTINKAMVCNSAVDSADQLMLFETAMPNPPTLVTSDQLTPSYSITI